MEAKLMKAHFRAGTWKEKKRALKKYLVHTAVRWKLFQAQRYLIGKCSTGASLIHMVKGGETLTSIARKYGVSVLEVAAENDNIIDIDFVMEGERLNIPVHSQRLQMDSNKLYNVTLERWKTISEQKVISNLPSNFSHIANPIGYLLVVGPLVAICISLIIRALQHRATKKANHQGLNESQGPYFGPRTDRWRTILDDGMATHSPDALSVDDSAVSTEYNEPFEKDSSPIDSEEMSHEYRKLESTYVKFLSECGMGKWGDFPGGSPI